ncbi:probable GPI-anchored adhesin-like protein PGA55 [Hyalella azteca]|uniref:Probable GPI-anchored adhesin-like protein PGA55 n=1 Tax=Hyalella azteca TaxID=294128 RepID=A0A8B7PH75_HYAAZ|nr:probable GPI-anchored adhesin-like protein PGA55 [Hyalella azteca]
MQRPPSINLADNASRGSDSDNDSSGKEENDQHEIQCVERSKRNVDFEKRRQLSIHGNILRENDALVEFSRKSKSVIGHSDTRDFTSQESDSLNVIELNSGTGTSSRCVWGPPRPLKVPSGEEECDDGSAESEIPEYNPAPKGDEKALQEGAKSSTSSQILCYGTEVSSSTESVGEIISGDSIDNQMHRERADEKLVKKSYEKIQEEEKSNEEGEIEKSSNHADTTTSNFAKDSEFEDGDLTSGDVFLEVDTIDENSSHEGTKMAKLENIGKDVTNVTEVNREEDNAEVTKDVIQENLRIASLTSEKLETERVEALIATPNAAARDGATEFQKVCNTTNVGAGTEKKPSEFSLKDTSDSENVAILSKVEKNSTDVDLFSEAESKKGFTNGDEVIVDKEESSDHNEVKSLQQHEVKEDITCEGKTERDSGSANFESESQADKKAESHKVCSTGEHSDVIPQNVSESQTQTPETIAKIAQTKEPCEDRNSSQNPDSPMSSDKLRTTASNKMNETEKVEKADIKSQLIATLPYKADVDEHGRPIRKSLSTVARTSSLKQKAYDKFSNRAEEGGSKGKTHDAEASSKDRKVSRAESFTKKALKLISTKKQEEKDENDAEDLNINDKAHGMLYLRKKRWLSPWRKYFFVLDGSQLTYYRSPQHYSSLTGCQGSLDLTLLNDVVKKKTSSFFWTCYPLLLERRSLSPLLLGADSAEEQQRWHELLQRAVGARKAVGRKFSSKASSSTSSPDIVVSTLPASSKKSKRKNSFGHSFSLRRKSKDKIKEESDSEEQHGPSKNDNARPDGNELAVKFDREADASREEDNGLVKPKTILKVGIPLRSSEISSIRLKKVNIAEICTQDEGSSSSSRTEKNQEQNAEQTFGVQLKKASFKGKRDAEKVKSNEKENLDAEGEHDFRSLLKSRRISTTGVDKKLYVKYGKDEQEETAERTPRKRSPSPSIPLSKSLMGVINRGTDEDNFILDDKKGNEVQTVDGGTSSIRYAKSTEAMDSRSGELGSLNHATTGKIRNSDPQIGLESYKNSSMHLPLKLQFSEERRGSSMLETVELLQDSSVIKGAEIEHEELINSSNEGERLGLNATEMDTKGLAEPSPSIEDLPRGKISTLTNIILSPTRKNCPQGLLFKAEDSSATVRGSVSPLVLTSDDVMDKVDSDAMPDVYSEECKDGVYGTDEQSLTKDLAKTKVSVKDNVSEFSALKEIGTDGFSFEKKDKLVEQKKTEDVGYDESTERKMSSANSESLESVPQSTSDGDFNELQECELRYNYLPAIPIAFRNSEPAPFSEIVPTACLESRRTSATELVVSARPEYIPQISTTRSSSVESGEPLVRTSFMGGHQSWGSGPNICIRNSSSDTNTSKESLTSSPANQSRRQSLGNDLAVPEQVHGGRHVNAGSTAEAVTPPQPNSSSAVTRGVQARKRSERPASTSNRESLILPEFVVVEEDPADVAETNLTYNFKA